MARTFGAPDSVPAGKVSIKALIGSAPSSSSPETLSLEHHEKEMIIKALEAHRGKRKDAAKALGISERTLYRKINEYGINL